MRAICSDQTRPEVERAARLGRAAIGAAKNIITPVLITPIRRATERPSFTTYEETAGRSFKRAWPSLIKLDEMVQKKVACWIEPTKLITMKQGCPSRHEFWLCAGAIFTILVVAAAIRIRGALNDLWLDEIWSLNLVREISSPRAVFTGIHQENNQYLNSLCLYFLGPHGNWPGYRIPSLMAGMGSVVLAWLIGRRRSVPCAFFAMLLVGFSYVMVLYSSEARGYAALVFFSFLTFYVLERHLEKPCWTTAGLLSFSEVMGFLSHLTFFYFFCAVMVWSGWRFARSNPGFKRASASMLAGHALPLLVFGWLYFVDIRVLVMGGGTPSSLIKVYDDALAWTVGFPGGVPPLAVALAVVVVFGAGLWLLGRERSVLPVFFVCVMIAPVLMIVIKHHQFIYVRYFLISMAFALILISFLLGWLYERGRMGKGICLLFLAAYFLANGWHMMALFRDGRGHYGEAARMIAEQSKGSVVTIRCENDFRISTVLQFYIPGVMGDRTVKYYQNDLWPKDGPEWVICYKESFEDPLPPGTQFTDPAGNSYELFRTFPTAPLSGLHWFVYHAQIK